MLPKQDLAIVLRSVAYEERHRIITAITEQHGVVSALARNSIQSRRFGGSLDLFAASLWTFIEKPGVELLQLQEALIRRPFAGIREDLGRLSLASAFSEFLLKLAPRHESCSDLFRLHSNALATLEELPEAAGDIRLLNAYLTKILQWSGSQPRLTGCIECKTALEEFDSGHSLTCIISEAGWMCPNCRGQHTRHIHDQSARGFEHSSLRLTPRAIRDFQTSLMVPIRQTLSFLQAPVTEHHELFKFLEALFVFHLPGFDRTPVKSLRFLELESSVRPQAVNPR